MISKRFCFAIKAFQIFWLGSVIEIKRRRFTKLNAHRALSSEALLEANDRLSKLGNRWMELRSTIVATREQV